MVLSRFRRFGLDKISGVRDTRTAGADSGGLGLPDLAAR